jgi:heme A synthase
MAVEQEFVEQEMEDLRKDPRFNARDLTTSYLSWNTIAAKPLVARMIHIVLLCIAVIVIIGVVYSVYHMPNESRMKILASCVGIFLTYQAHKYVERN